VFYWYRKNNPASVTDEPTRGNLISLIQLGISLRQMGKRLIYLLILKLMECASTKGMASNSGAIFLGRNTPVLNSFLVIRNTCGGV
jgi:hypothetical protein